MIVGVLTIIAGALLLLCSIIMLTYSKWIGHVQSVLHVYNSGRLFLNRLVRDAYYEASLFSRTMKGHFSVKPGKTGMIYSK